MYNVWTAVVYPLVAGNLITAAYYDNRKNADDDNDDDDRNDIYCFQSSLYGGNVCVAIFSYTTLRVNRPQIAFVSRGRACITTIIVHSNDESYCFETDRTEIDLFSNRNRPNTPHATGLRLSQNSSCLWSSDVNVFYANSAFTLFILDFSFKSDPVFQ